MIKNIYIYDICVSMDACIHAGMFKYNQWGQLMGMPNGSKITESGPRPRRLGLIQHMLHAEKEMPEMWYRTHPFCRWTSRSPWRCLPKSIPKRLHKLLASERCRQNPVHCLKWQLSTTVCWSLLKCLIPKQSLGFGEALDLLLAANGSISVANTSQSLSQMPFIMDDADYLMCLTSVS